MADENQRPAESSSSASASPQAQQATLAGGNRIGPNGVILGPDGKPCKACNSLKAFGSAFGGGRAKSSSSSHPGGKGAASASATATSTSAAAAGAAILNASQPVQEDDDYRACPADSEQLGRHTWTFLHSTAAYYPDKPSELHKKHALGLFNSLPTLYPCRYCADELKNEIKTIGPPDVSSGPALSDWLCRIHNEVNARLGKREFDCSKVLKRWKDGWEDGSCD